MGLARTAVFAGCLLLFLAVDVSGNKCTVGCHGMHGGKAYQEGHTYIYDLEGSSITSVPDAQGDATLQLKGTVELSVKPDCIRQLRLKGVQINGAPISLPDVEKYALQFNYHDGHIDTEVCTEADDSQASLNIKRAVASLFQSAVFQDSGYTTHHEVDVFGGCPTDFTFRKDGDSLVVHKERNLVHCSHRETIKDGLVSASFDPKSNIHSFPLLASHQKIEQRFKRGILNKATSVETYNLKPFSNGDIGAKTIVQTVLTLKGEKGDSPKAPVSQPKSLIFEAPHPVIKSSIDSIVAALKAASAEVADSVKENAAEKFTELVKVLRLSSKNDILAIYQKVKSGVDFDKDVDKKILLDALFHSKSGEVAEVVIDLIKNHELSVPQTLLFYTSLAFVDHVNLPSVTAITSLLEQPDLPRIGYLGVGQVIGKYCQQHTCENVPEVKQAIHKIRDKVGNGKAKTRDQENLIVAALKALGNTKFLDDASLLKLAGIAEDKNVRNRVRVAAIEALPTRCSMKWKNILLKVLADREEDSEIRIESYLALVACPCPHVANSLKEILDKETINQVGSFMQSHLRNLRASADPNKAEAKRQLGLLKPRTKFPEDFRKFSFNNEASYHVGSLGMGSFAESNVIYSQESFVPRSVNLNLTTEIFGRSFNFMELNARVENLDRLIEHYFGPKGRLTQDEISDMMEKGIDDTASIAAYVKEKVNKLRKKREVKQGELDKFAKNVKLRHNEVDQDFDLDLSLKLFGVEMAYLTYNDHMEQLKPEQIIDKIFDKLQVGFDKVKKVDHNMRNYVQFLDTELIYPTNLGTELSLNLVGSSATNMKMNYKLDIPAILKNPNNADVHIAVQPSVAIRIVGSMIVKAVDAESGMKIVGTLHSDTVWDIAVKMLDGKGIDIVVGAPKKKEKIIGLSSQVLMSSGPKGNVYKAPKFSKGKIYSDCFEQSSAFLSVLICGHLEFPYDGIESMQKRALFPLNGPSKFNIDWENHASSYHFKLYYDTKSPKSRSFEILAELPNNKDNKRVSLLIEGGLEPKKYAKISFDSPIKKASVEALLKDTDQERMLMITVHSDQQEYFARVGISANGAKYKPILEYKVPEHIEKLTGTKSMTKNGGQQYNVQGTVEVIDQDGGKKYVFDKVALMVSDQRLVGLDGHVLSTKDTAGLDMNLSYGDESLLLRVEGKKLGEQHYSVGVSALPSKDPNVGFNIKGEIHNTPHDLKNELIFIHGPDPKSEVNRFTLKQHIMYKPKEAGTDFMLGMSNKISYPALKMLLDLEGKLTPNSVYGDIEIAYDKFKFCTELSAKRNMVTPGDYELEFETELLQNSIKLKSKRTIVEPHKSKFKNSIELTPGGKYESEVMLLHIREKNKLNFELDGDLNLDGKKVKALGSLNVEPANIVSRVFVTVSDVKYIDFLLKLRQGANPQGSLTLNLKNYLTVGGQMSMQNNKGNAHLNIDLPKFNRKIKGTGDLVITGTQHVANFELLFDAEKDPNKRIKLSTVTDVKKNDIDTKNVIEMLDYKLELNGKSKLEGTFNEGELTIDMDITLPNGRYLVYKGKRTSVKKDDDKYDIHVNAEIMNYISKGGESQKITYVAHAEKLDFKTHSFQSNGHLSFVDYNGDKADLVLNIKNFPGADGYEIMHDLDLNLSATKLPRPFNLHHKHLKRNDGELTYKIDVSLGKDMHLETTQHFVPGNHVDKPCTFTSTNELKLPSDKLRNIKLDIKGNSLDHPDEDGPFDVQGSAMLTYNDDKSFKIEGSHKQSGIFDNDHAHEGDTKLTLILLKMLPLTIHDSFKYEPNSEKVKITRNSNIKYGEKEATLSIDSLTFTRDLSHININAKATTPFEKLHQMDFLFNHESGKDGHSRTTDLVIAADNEKITVKSEIQNGNPPKVNIRFASSSTELVYKFEKLGNHEYTGEYKVKTRWGFVAADAHLNLESVDNFVINANFDSDKIKHRKLHAEIANKPNAKTGRRIIITVTSDGKNLIAGSTNYKRREEAGKIIVEGSGNMKIGEDTKSSSFKYTRQHLSRETDGEIGVVIVLNAKFDSTAIVSELKSSNKEMLVSNSYCEQSKDCAHFKLQSTYDTDYKDYLKHQITVEVDLKKFNIPAEFGLKTSTEYKDLMFDHSANLYLHSSKDKSEYTYQVYVHPKKSAAILTLPNRELALIGTFDLPKTKQTGAYKIDLSLYLDRKNKPADKTSLLSTGDINIEKDSLSLSGEMKFIYPSQPKDMMVKGRLHYGGEHLLDANVDIDVFAKKTQKIVVVAKVHRQQLNKGCNYTSVIEVNSRGQQLKVELKSHAAFTHEELGFGTILSYTDEHQKPKSVSALFAVKPTEAYLYVISPDKDVIRADAKLQVTKNLQKMDAEVAIAGGQPTVYNLEAQDFSSFKYMEYMKDNPNKKLVVNGRIILGQLAEIHADAFKDGAKKDLFHLLVHLDEGKFLKPDFGYNKDNLVHLMEFYRNENIELLKQLKDVSTDVATEIETEMKDLIEHLRKAQPNIKPLLEYYQAELNKLKDELHADQTIKDMQATLHKHFGAIITAIAETMKLVSERLVELRKQYQELISNIESAFKTVYPQLKESYNKIFHACVNVLDTAANVGIAYIKAILNLINEHQKELKEMAIIASEFAQDIAKIIFKGIGQIRKEINGFVELLRNQMKALPIYELAKEKYQEVMKFQVPEAVLNTIEELSNLVKAMLPTEEFRQLYTACYEYVIKHVKHQKVDDVSEIKKIYSLTIDAIRSIFGLFESQVNLENLYSLLENQLSSDFAMLAKLPAISTLKISLLDLLRGNELPTPLDVYHAYRPTLRPSDIVPPFSKIGIVVDGGHFFTFDGSHFSMPGDCTYILAQDMQDGNFSVVANFNKGNLVSVTVTEPKESITMKNNGNVLVNSKPADYPANTKNLHAFLVNPTAHVKSDYGVHVTCGYKTAMVCTVRVSGFYHGKLRGLLGDGNNEYYDDYTLPSGKITESETEFANGYKLKPDCAAVNAIDHKTQERNPVCTEYFSGEKSTLKGCFNYVNPTYYREACDNGVKINPETPCLIAAAYYSTCYYKRVFRIAIPPACTSCKVGTDTIAIGDKFSVKIPKKQADIILVIEQDIRNEKVVKDLLGPLITDLREELKQHGITDAYVGLIGFGEHMNWPQHYTVGGNLNIEGEVKNMKFEKADPIVTFEDAKKGTTEKKLTFLEQRLDIELGNFKLTDAYEEAIHYPFRAGAAKTVVVIMASACEKSPLPLTLQQLRLLRGQQVYQDLGMKYHHMYFPGDIQVSGKTQKNIVGYDRDNVYVFGDNKKKPLGGNSEFRTNMVLPSADVCANFAMASGGTAFSSNNFMDAKPNQKRQFAQVAARKIAEGLVDTEIEKDCMCEQYHGLIGYPACQIVGRREKEQLAKHTKGGVKA